MKIVIEIVIRLIAFMDVIYGFLHEIYYNGWKCCRRKECFCVEYGCLNLLIFGFDVVLIVVKDVNRIIDIIVFWGGKGGKQK